VTLRQPPPAMVRLIYARAMRCCMITAVVLGACGFRSAGAVPDDAPAPSDAPAPDAAAVPDAAGDAALPAFCDPTDSHLMACYEFEGGGHDGSSHHLDAVTTGVAFPDGQVGKALQLMASGDASAADSAVFDVTNLTIEAWIRPAQLPVGGRAGIIDVDGQYGFFVYPGPQLSCILINGPTVNASPVAIAVDHWSHVACTYDGAKSMIYVDGTMRGMAAGGGTLATNGNTGMTIAANNPPRTGDRLSGLIDQVRLLNVARTAAEICADAGKTGCP
jgi:hypothetical protein